MTRTHGAFIQARYSTDNQNADSIEVQVEACTRWCREHSLPILGIYADCAVSGTKDSRPQLDAMMDALRHGLADTVVIYDQSRLSRNVPGWFRFREELDSMGVTLISATQSTVGGDLRDPTVFLTEGANALFNHMWVLQTRQKTVEKLRFMARTGQHTGGTPPLGFTVEDGRLVICPEEASLVQRIFQEYASGMSYREIIQGLNRDGLRTKRGSPFGTNSLHDLLKNEKYIGTIVYGSRPYRKDGTRNTHAADGDAVRIENALPAIIDRHTFDLVQARMAQNRRAQAGAPPTTMDYPLKGKVFCLDCGSSMVVSRSNQNYTYYRCSGHKRLKDSCPTTPIRVDSLEQYVANAVRSILGSPSMVDELIAILREQSSRLQTSAVSELQLLMDKDSALAKKLDNAADAILSGLTSPTLTAKIAQLEQERTLLAQQMLALRHQVDAASLPESRLRELLDQVIKSDSADPALLAIVSRVEVGKDEIRVYTIFDPTPGDCDFHAPTISAARQLITIPGTSSGVPTILINRLFLLIKLKR